MGLKSVIFDMDGVITDTAKIHFKAWKKIFDNYLIEDAEKRKISFLPFTLDDYIRYVDGLSRRDGIKYFLQSRKIISSGENPSPEEEETIAKIAAIKNKTFLQLIEKEGVSVFESTVLLIKELQKNDIKTAVISSSFNCQDILKKANLISLFDTIVDGKALQTSHLKGKPNPDIFLEAAKRIQANPSQTVVIEDAISGIIAGKAGQFGLVIGIDRQQKWASQFKQHGADIVVRDLSEIKLTQIKQKLINSPSLKGICIGDIKKDLINKRIILFCDYDGTLTPIVKRPKLAHLSHDIKDTLFRLKNYCDIVIISGRELSNLETMVGINGLYYIGNHGFEIIGPKHFATKFEVGKEFLSEIQRAHQDLISLLSSTDNCIIEDKKFSLSVHYRLVTEEKEIAHIKEVMRKISANYPRLVMHYGKKVFELRPNFDWNKGKALNFLIQKLNYPKNEYIPIYLGDDITDEDGFSAVSKNGIGILVSDEVKETYAHYRLHNPSEVNYFLKDMLDFLTHTSPENIDTAWSLTYSDFQPKQEMLREALCTLGNGYFATRAAAEESSANDNHYPGTYFAGCYNQLKSVIHGKDIYNEDLVNMPNWLPITFKIINNESSQKNNNDAWFSLDEVEILNYHQKLNMKTGILTRKLRFRDKNEHITELEFLRFVSMANPHLAGQKFTLKPINWSGHVLVKSGIDGSITNSGISRYRKLNSKHLEAFKITHNDNGKINLLMRTNQSHIEISYTAFHRLYKNGILLKTGDYIEEQPESIYCYFECNVDKNQVILLEKLVAVATNKDMASSDCLTDTQNIIELVKNENFKSLLDAHSLAWKNLWYKCDIEIESEGDDQRILRLHIFHLLQTVSKNSVDLDVGVPARGLHGESYRGHIFWDELFIMPFYIFYFPEMARSLLLYRYRRLNMARLLASKSGYKGAMYPWQSGSNGDEVTQSVHLNPMSNQWIPDFSHYQRHVNAAIVYNIWTYYLATNDKNFINDYGAEMILEIARFWSSIAVYSPITGRYEINNIVGPDEYHEKYPNSKKPGVNNNAYTNIMAVWSIECALKIFSLLMPYRRRELKKQLHIDKEEIKRWNDITTKMKVPFHEDVIISQFDGYEKLPEFNWSYYIEKYGNIERLDRILKAENDTPDNYKVSKQADVLMLFYLFSYEELTALFKKLGYEFSREILVKNIFYYLKYTSHGSTLSKVIFASLAKYIEQDIALKYYHDVLNSDIMDIQGGTTSEGIHLAAMASCVNIILMCFAGIDIKNYPLKISPQLPMRISEINFNLQYRQKWLNILIDKDHTEVKLNLNSKGKLNVMVNDRLKVIKDIV
jgi:alpha,alpha-trehalase